MLVNYKIGDGFKGVRAHGASNNWGFMPAAVVHRPRLEVPWLLFPSQPAPACEQPPTARGWGQGNSRIPQSPGPGRKKPAGRAWE